MWEWKFIFNETSYSLFYGFKFKPNHHQFGIPVFSSPSSSFISPPFFQLHTHPLFSLSLSRTHARTHFTFFLLPYQYSNEAKLMPRKKEREKEGKSKDAKKRKHFLHPSSSLLMHGLLGLSLNSFLSCWQLSRFYFPRFCTKFKTGKPWKFGMHG